MLSHAESGNFLTQRGQGRFCIPGSGDGLGSSSLQCGSSVIFLDEAAIMLIALDVLGATHAPGDSLSLWLFPRMQAPLLHPLFFLFFCTALLMKHLMQVWDTRSKKGQF